MQILKIKSQIDGSHCTQTVYGRLSYIPDGWAVIPEDMVCENFPFGEVTAEEIDGVMTVTSWTAGEIPEPEPMPEPEPTTAEILDTLLGVSE